MVSAPPEHALMVIAGQGQGTLTLSTTGSFLEQMRTRMVVNDFFFLHSNLQNFFPVFTVRFYLTEPAESQETEGRVGANIYTIEPY